jgi:hypothetical protein
MTTEFAVIDRFEGDLAVLLVGEQRELMNVPRSHLPHHAREGDYLRIELQDNQVINVTVDEQATAEARNRIEEKLKRLRRGDHLRDG